MGTRRPADHGGVTRRDSAPEIGDDAIAATIVALLRSRAADASICPSEAARALAGEEAAWRALMPRVRSVAMRWRDARRLRITRGGRDVAPGDEQRGAIRLARGPGFDAVDDGHTSHDKP
jgi:Protein of unknown function (DUF3253)